MFGIFMESLVIFKLYTGLKFLLVLTALAWIYLLIKEKNTKVRILFVYAPILILLLFLCPISRKVFVAAGLDGETYYRVLWTLPLGMITSYGACILFAKHRRIGLAVSAALIILCGSYVYKSDYISKAENLYHIPDTVVEICDLIGPESDDAWCSAVMPPELIHFVRQYDSRIHMPYGREMLVDRWDYYNEVYAAMEEPKAVDISELLNATRKEYCQYIVFAKDREINASPESCGLQLMAEIDGYKVYKDPETAEVVEQWQSYYEEE